MRRQFLLVLALSCAACSFKHDPDTERFLCARDADCGDGHVCVTQRASGKGVCFTAGACSREVCNGQDDDCDGVIDDVVDAGSPCTTGLQGACSAGTLVCGAGPELTCVATHLPGPEACDGSTADLNCNGLVACADPECDGTHACGPGCTCASGGKVETDCSNGIDDDGNGLTDCEDPACRGRSCGGGGNCGIAGPHIGDGGLDAGSPDAGSGDGGFSDAGLGDAGLSDAGAVDGGRVDAGIFDAGFSDGGSVDGGSIDAGFSDAGFSDAGSVDGGLDGGLADAGPRPTPDAGAYCAFPEAVCDNGLDDDGDGRTDCLDTDCLGRRCNADGGRCLADGGCR